MSVCVVVVIVCMCVGMMPVCVCVCVCVGGPPLTLLVSFQDLLQHAEGVGLPGGRARLLVLLDHLVDLRVAVEPLHGKVTAGAAAEGKVKGQRLFTGIYVSSYINILPLGSKQNIKPQQIKRLCTRTYTRCCGYFGREIGRASCRARV